MAPMRHSMPPPPPPKDSSSNWRTSTDSSASSRLSFSQRLSAQQQAQFASQVPPQKPTIIIPPPSRAGPTPSSPERSISAVTTPGQSRFVEGSMNDRVSAVPPAAFLSGEATEEEIDRYERQFYAPLPSPCPSAPVTHGYGYGGYFGQDRQQSHHIRSRSSVQGIGSSFMSGREDGERRLSKKFSLAPLWDGVKEKLSLRSSRSSGSITSFSSFQKGILHRRDHSQQSHHNVLHKKQREEVGLGLGLEGDGMEVEQEKVEPEVGKKKDTTGYPTREEILESYKNLQASGFFTQHAIKSTRHPLRTAASAPLAGTGGSGMGNELGSPPAKVMGPPTLPVTGGAADRRSFAERLAAVNELQQLKTVNSFSNANSNTTTQNQQQHFLFPVSPPPRTSSMPAPPAGSSSPASSPGSRGTKRPSQDIGGEAETATRKLVKKLRRSTSKSSFSGATSIFGKTDAATRPSTSTGGYASSSFSEEYFSPSPPPQSPQKSPVKKLGLGKLTKVMPTTDKDGKKKRTLLGLRRRNQNVASVAASATAPAAPAVSHEEKNNYSYRRSFDGDHRMAMMEEMMEEEEEEQGQEDIDMIDASIPAPPAHVFFGPEFKEKPQSGHHYHYPQRRRTVSGNSAHSAVSSSSKMSVDTNGDKEPLCVVPDPNRGIPSVPRIPRTLLFAGRPVVVDIDEERRVKREERERMRKSRESLVAESKKREQRDSGLGDDVENIPVW
ncbi:hypothetical protein QBC35DRAFT_82979 [Podospora australis]|uniref:Uncharacterized protein n=1 Tax=Podospora australis TaxID=1536484 RepID=A0AAN6WP95_9PEZI|nr:hypothetical protein QBC35DRAFT_82979 [Podospora australis]